jgi:hypothetical protein
MANTQTQITPARVGFHRRARGPPTDRARVNDDHPEESNPSEESNPGAGAGALGGRLEGGGGVGTGGGAIGADAVEVGAGDGDAAARGVGAAVAGAGTRGTDPRGASPSRALSRGSPAWPVRGTRLRSSGRAATVPSRFATGGRVPDGGFGSTVALAAGSGRSRRANAVITNAARKPAAIASTTLGRGHFTVPRIAPLALRPAPGTDPIATEPRAGGSRSP